MDRRNLIALIVGLVLISGPSYAWTRAQATGGGSGGSGGAPTNADYLVGTSNGSLSNEIVAGTTPGGELGGTWGTPTIDDSVAVSTWNLTTPTITTSLITSTPTTLTVAELDRLDGLSGTIVTTVAGTATLAANVSDTDFGDVTVSSGAWAVEDNSHAHTTTTISGLDIGDDTNLAAGRSLTLSGDSVESDAELYTDTKCIWFENPVATDDFKSIWFAKQAATITSIWAESDQTVTFMLQVDDGSPADVDSVDLAPAAGTAEDTSLDGDATMAVGDRLDLATTSVSGTPTWCSICWTFTYDD